MGGHWNHCFSQPLNDWKVDDVEDLFFRLQRMVVDTEGENKMLWMNLDNNKFFVKLLYSL